MVRRVKLLFCVFQAFLLLISSLAGPASDLKKKVDRYAMGLTSTTDLSFAPLTAGDAAVSERERQRCRSWYEAHLLSCGAPAYDFTVGLKPFSRSRSDWEISVGPESAENAIRRGGKTTLITLTHKKSGLIATVEATIYEAFATCEWTVYLKNGGNANTPAVKDFYAADCTLETGETDVYFSKGTLPAADDFELMRSPVGPTDMVFSANGGRSASWLPYWNLSGEDAGVVAAMGWTGQWYAALKQTAGGVRFRAKQETFSGYLTPGETVRSPLVSLTFYSGGNTIKGFNTFRNWERACVYTESAYPLTTTVLAGEFDRRTADDYIAQINAMDAAVCAEADFLWRDAGWYPIKKDWYDSVGTWQPDPARFPAGLAPVAEAAEARGMELLLWFEPERCCAGTEVYEACKTHDGWLIETNDPNRNMVNLANDDCCAYLGNLVANAIKDNKVGLYRQDFNFDPLELWQKADKTLYGGRKGFEENHYVTNLYKYLDTLLAVNPGLIIDNCASGGKRLDTEMTRRSIPLWRSDYNCMTADGKLPADILEATQSATYGLSFWLPLHGTGIGGAGEYLWRSALVPCTQTTVGYKQIQNYMAENYYPLLYGGRDQTKYLAMQFGSDAAGAALIYKREQVGNTACTVVLSGLSPAASYIVYDFDHPEAKTVKTGEELMTGGLTHTVPETPKAVILLYEKTAP